MTPMGRWDVHVSCSLEAHSRDGEVDDGGVLLHKEVILGESFDAKDEVRRQFGQLEPLEEVLLVGFVLLRGHETEAAEDSYCGSGARQDKDPGLGGSRMRTDRRKET